MKKILVVLCTLGCCVSFSRYADAMALRYALIIGNNVGVDAHGGEPFPALKHAEQEAGTLKRKLVSLSNFDASPKRTRLLVGATREQVFSALRSLASQKKRDIALVGKSESLFLFYFTGHGLEGELLLEDGPVTADEVGEMFRQMNADFSVGVFDACYSGSLREEALKTKGVRSTPGLNLFREMPKEILSAEGRIWYVSSGPGQASYEDDAIGGVFTHFFIKALDEAPLDGPGITLERIWHFARQNTVEYTARRNRDQVPEQFISKLKASSPIYFSFPLERNATLVLSDSVEGQFALSYADGHLTEIVKKKKGKPQKLAVYPGRARLILIRDGKGRTLKEFHLKSNEEVVLHHAEGEAPHAAIGEQSVSLWEKGIGVEKPITASTVSSGVSALIGASYNFDLSENEALIPTHLASLLTRVDYAKLSFGLRLGYGFDTHSVTSWHYKAHALTTCVNIGAGLDIRKARLSPGVAFRFSYIWQKYGDEQKRQGLTFQPAPYLSWAYPTASSVLGEVRLYAGPVRAPGIGIEDKYRWSFAGGLGLVGYVRAH